jgi:hypothetical protein
MTPNPTDDSRRQAVGHGPAMHEGGLRNAPVLENGRHIGMASAPRFGLELTSSHQIYQRENIAEIHSAEHYRTGI